jgi:hypothetical protein
MSQDYIVDEVRGRQHTTAEIRAQGSLLCAQEKDDGLIARPCIEVEGKSGNPMVPAKLPNKAGQPAAEVVEGRGLTKENAVQQNTCRTQDRQSVPNALDAHIKAATALAS